MPRLFLIIALVLFASTAAAAQTSANERKVEQELLKVKREMLDAYNRRDKAAVLSLLADGYFETEPDGKIFDRQNVALRAVNNPTGLKITESVKEVRLLVTGDTAVMSYRSDVRLEGGGMSGSAPSRQVTDVYVRKGGRWLLAASHSSDLPAEGTAGK